MKKVILTVLSVLVCTSAFAATPAKVHGRYASIQARGHLEKVHVRGTLKKIPSPHFPPVHTSK